MPKLSELFKSLAKKAGLNVDDEKYADAFKIEGEVPDEVASALEKNLMNESAALNNTKIKSTIKAQLYNGIDSDFEGSLDEFELPDDVKASILGEKKTVDRVKKLSAHLKEEAGKASKAGNKEEAAALRKQVEDLNKSVKTKEDDYKNNQIFLILSRYDTFHKLIQIF